ncbi:MAG TPA: dihydrolipoamide acetyltransferase family protein [Ktedonobacterales bacterium]|nr:dihydrolipoamide acetyltransferase family protein [Ktedonobacterales bacterium]
MGQFMLPDLGEGLEEAQVTRWLVAVGDRVTLNQHLCEVETAKALVEIPSPWAGTVQALHAKPGDTVPVGAPLITIAEEGAAGAENGEGPVLVGYGAHGPAQAFTRRRRGGAAPPASTPAPSPAPAAAQVAEEEVKASPLVRKMAAERGINLAAVVGTGPGGRIRVEDLDAAAPATPAAAPAPAASEGEERISTVGLRKAIAAKMVRSATTIPHFTEYGLFDVTNLIALRERLKADPAYSGLRLTFLPFFVLAVVQATRQYPIMNSRWDEEGAAIVIKKRINVGLATDTERGLVVPVIRDAQALSLAQVAAECDRLAPLAREGRLTPTDMTGGTITITNVGAMGPVETGAPLINAPEVCVIGFGAIKPRPTVVDGSRLEVRPGAWISISCDHRVVDGATAAQYMGALVAALESPDGLTG